MNFFFFFSFALSFGFCSSDSLNRWSGSGISLYTALALGCFLEELCRLPWLLRFSLLLVELADTGGMGLGGELLTVGGLQGQSQNEMRLQLEQSGTAGKEACCNSREQEVGYLNTSFRRLVRNISYTGLKLTVLPICCLRGGFSRSV